MTARITSLLLIIVSLSFAETRPVVDTLARAALKDTLVKLQADRAARRAGDSANCFSITEKVLFNTDVMDISESAGTIPLLVPVQFSLSNRLNRFLPYGNVAPVMQIYQNGPLLPVSPDPFRGTDDVSLAEISTISLQANNVCRYTPFPALSAVPEAAIFWENGVFGENIFAMRFMRPVTKNMTMNAFSNYRYFKGTPYNHDRNNVFSFYRSMVTDSSLLSNNGYNPLSTDFSSGARINWAGEDGKTMFWSAKYADCSDEFAVDSAGTGPTGPVSWASLSQYRTTFDGGATSRFGRFFLEWQGRFNNDVLKRTMPGPASNALPDERGSNQEAALGARSGTAFFGQDTLSLTYRAHWVKRETFQDAESRSLAHMPGVAAVLPFTAGNIRGSVTADAGATAYTLNDSTDITPQFSVSASGGIFGQNLRLYAKQGVLPLFMAYDNHTAGTPLLDNYRLVGVEAALRKHRAMLVLGCQSIEGVSDHSVRSAWLLGALPYEQPAIVFFAAPALGIGRNLTVRGHGCFSDTKPFVKAGADVHYAIYPKGLRETIDLKLGTDYWSKRDTMVFAGVNDWNREIFDVNSEIAVHIADFRFFSKISNILNRKYAWVPGYYSPGITFRWGITWFLQK
ncbi:MAG: hypothetical protein MUF22_00345 [Chitinispirillaceae bacterium]|jgi:hypothetical protein|nr:hypothetical protein [Chitinispirillaceae bacterium]